MEIGVQQQARVRVPRPLSEATGHNSISTGQRLPSIARARQDYTPYHDAGSGDNHLSSVYLARITEARDAALAQASVQDKAIQPWQALTDKAL